MSVTHCAKRPRRQLSSCTRAARQAPLPPFFLTPGTCIRSWPSGNVEPDWNGEPDRTRFTTPCCGTGQRRRICGWRIVSLDENRLGGRYRRIFLECCAGVGGLQTEHGQEEDVTVQQQIRGASGPAHSRGARSMGAKGVSPAAGGGDASGVNGGAAIGFPAGSSSVVAMRREGITSCVPGINVSLMRLFASRMAATVVPC